MRDIREAHLRGSDQGRVIGLYAGPPKRTVTGQHVGHVEPEGWIYHPATQGLIRLAVKAITAGFRLTNLDIRPISGDPDDPVASELQSFLSYRLRYDQEEDIYLLIPTIFENHYLASIELAAEEGTRIRITRDGLIDFGRPGGAQAVWERLFNLLSDTFHSKVKDFSQEQ